MNVKASVKLKALRLLRAAGFSDVELCHAFGLASMAQLRRTVLQLEDLEKRSESMFFCTSTRCPGYTYKASDRAHPAETCGS